MKTKYILIALLGTIQTATAGKVNAPAVKVPSSSAMRSVSKPSFIFNKPAAPTQKAPAVFRTAPRVSTPRSAFATQAPQASAPSVKPTPRLSGSLNQPGIRRGFDAGHITQGIGKIQRMIPSGQGQSFGMEFTTPRGPDKPNMNFGGNETFTPRSPKNPLDRFAQSGTGGTDIRKGAGSSRRGTDFNITSQTTHNPDGTTTTVIKQHDSSGRVTDYTSTTTDTNSEVLFRQEQHAGERSVEVHTSSRNADGTYTHQTRGYGPDGSGHLGWSWTSDNPYSSPDRSPEGSSVGGPVNSTGPSVAQVAGLESLDLLRQKAEGQGAHGANTMTTGRVSSNQVLPVGDMGTSFGGAKRNGINISTNPEATVGRGVNGPAGGPDKPD